jgi:hypothetical protein
MVGVGDRIRLTLNKGAAREGIVTDVTGSMLRVRWGSGDESTVIPGPGTLTVLGRIARKASRPTKPPSATAKGSNTKAASRKRATVKRAAGDRSIDKKTSGRPTATKRATASDEGGSRRPSRSKQGGQGQQSRG